MQSLPLTKFLRHTTISENKRRFREEDGLKTRVLWSVRQPGFDANPFVTSLAASVSPRAQVLYFTWRLALVGRYDLIHLHWPEDLFRAKRSSVKLVKYMLFVCLVARIKLGRKPVLWTVHNNAPHEGLNGVESLLLRICMTMVTQRVFMTASQRKMFGDDDRGTVIRHGHYRDSYPRCNAGAQSRTDKSLLYFGFVRRYKGIEKLVQSFAALPDAQESYRLTIAGRPNPKPYGEELLSAFSEVKNISWLLDFQSEKSSAELFCDADLVVLPYKNMVNSGALLLGLSLGRPVLAPKNDVTQEIQQEVGSQWLHLYEGELTEEDLHRAVACSGDLLDGKEPDLSLRDWGLIGENYTASYSALVSREYVF